MIVDTATSDGDGVAPESVSSTEVAEVDAPAEGVAEGGNVDRVEDPSAGDGSCVDKVELASSLDETPGTLRRVGDAVCTSRVEAELDSSDIPMGSAACLSWRAEIAG